MKVYAVMAWDQDPEVLVGLYATRQAATKIIRKMLNKIKHKPEETTEIYEWSTDLKDVLQAKVVDAILKYTKFKIVEEIIHD